jgi:hypothetical protein
VVPAPSLLRGFFLTGVRLTHLEAEGDLDLELVLRRLRALRDLGGGDGLSDSEVDLLRLGGRGERELDSDGMDDLRRVPRFGLLPLPLPPPPPPL